MGKAAFALIGHGGAEQRFLRAKDSGRLHHGWIIQGPSGIGKSIFTKRLAANILGAQSPDAAIDDPVMQRVASLGHPDFKWISREPNEKGVLRQDISVDQIRELNHFFALKPAMAGWRVGVVDALDEMNVAGLNALLKTLEEPPANAILFLISHLQEPVLATIRSRCQILSLNALSAPDTEAVLSQFPEQAKLAGRLAQGRPGYGLTLADSGAASALQAANTLLKSITKPKSGVLSSALQAAITDNASLDAFGDHILNWTAEQASHNPELAKTWLTLHRIRHEAKHLNLTPLQTAAKLITTLQNDVRTLQPVT